MTLEEYAVKTIEELKNKKTEYEVAIQQLQVELKNAIQVIKDQRKNLDFIKQRLGKAMKDTKEDHFTRKGYISITVSDSWKDEGEPMTKEEQDNRNFFDWLGQIHREYLAECERLKKEKEKEEKLEEAGETDE